jgi:hypothetical protein
MSVGSCWPSASRRTAYWASAARAALMSVFTAAMPHHNRAGLFGDFGCVVCGATVHRQYPLQEGPHREELVKYLARAFRSLSVGRIIM